jgi:hypothetical protein
MIKNFSARVFKFTNAPVQFEQFLVAGGNDIILSILDECKDFGELGLQFMCYAAETNFVAIIRGFKFTLA